MATRLYVADVGESSGAEKRVVIGVEYGGKTARIEFRPSDPAFHGEAGLEVYRRDLHELMDALDAWEKSEKSEHSIQWHPTPFA